MVKTIINHRHQPGCHHSEPYLDRYKEFNNQGIKVQVKRTFKSCFLSRKKQGTGSAWSFLEFWVLVHCRFLKPTFQNQCSLIMLSFLFQFSCQDHQNGKYCHLLPQSSRITLKFISCNICTGTVGLLFLHKFCFLTNVYNPQWLWKVFKFMVFR